MKNRTFDVVIVGGGISGSALTYMLSKYTNVGSVAMLEKYGSLAPQWIRGKILMTLHNIMVITTKYLMMTMDTQTKRARELVKLLERLIKQDHLYDQENIKEMKSQLRAVKQQIADIEKENSKGFGK
jgi:malate dehydrogenase (quinone)